MTDYEIQRIARAVAELILGDERLPKRVAKCLPKKEKLLTSSQAAEMLGVSRCTICRLAPSLGGIRRPSKDGKGRWMFSEEKLIENFKSCRDKFTNQ